MPNKVELRQSHPIHTTYQVDFAHKQVTQMLIPRPRTSYDHKLTTTYRYVHGKDAPVYSQHNDMNSAVTPCSLTRLQRAKTTRPICHESVASCMSWCNHGTPASTATTDFNEHKHSASGACSHLCENHTPQLPSLECERL